MKRPVPLLPSILRNRIVMRSVASLTVAVAAASSFSPAIALAADPTTADCLAASDASLKSGNEHKLRAERSQLLVCAAPSCPADIRKDCVSRVDELNGQIPTIIFAARDLSTSSDLSAVRVTMDGEVLAERLEGTALSIDPGEHTFLFETSGQAGVTKKLVIRQGVEGTAAKRSPSGSHPPRRLRRRRRRRPFPSPRRRQLRPPRPPPPTRRRRGSARRRRSPS